MTPPFAHERLPSDMSRKVLITIEIPLSLREKVRASWMQKEYDQKGNGTRLKSFYTDLFKLGFKANEKSESVGDKVSNHLEKNRGAGTR